MMFRNKNAGQMIHKYESQQCTWVLTEILEQMLEEMNHFSVTLSITIFIARINSQSAANLSLNYSGMHFFVNRKRVLGNELTQNK